MLRGLPLVRIERCEERLGAHQRNLRRHGRKAEASRQARFERKFRAKPAVAQYLAQSDQLERGRTAPGYETSETQESLQPCVSLGLKRNATGAAPIPGGLTSAAERGSSLASPRRHFGNPQGTCFVGARVRHQHVTSAAPDHRQGGQQAVHCCHGLTS